jgi:hypothetical protein
MQTPSPCRAIAWSAWLPIERAFQRALRGARRAQAPHRIKGLLHVRQQEPHQCDLLAVDMALLSRTLDGEEGALALPNLECSTDVVAVSRRRQEAGVEVVVLHRPLVEHHGVENDVARPAVDQKRDTRIAHRILVEVGDVVARRQSVGMKFGDLPRRAVEGLERGRDAADRARNPRQSLRPKLGAETGRMHGLDRRQKPIPLRHAAPPFGWIDGLRPVAAA